MDFIVTTILEFLVYGLWTSTWVSLIVALIVGIIVGSIVWAIARRRQQNKSFKDSILPAIDF